MKVFAHISCQNYEVNDAAHSHDCCEHRHASEKMPQRESRSDGKNASKIGPQTVMHLHCDMRSERGSARNHSGAFHEYSEEKIRPRILKSIGKQKFT